MTDAWINCSKCGDRYGSFIAYCPKCGAKNASYKTRKKTMGIGKKIGIGITGAVAAFFVLGVIGFYVGVDTDDASNNSPSGSRQQQTTSSVEIQDSTPAPPIDSQPIEQSPAGEDTQTDTQPTETSPEPPIVSRSLEDIVPSRQDVGTTWRMGSSGTNVEGLEGAEGVVQTLYQGYTRSKEGSNQLVVVVLVKFDKIENADRFYDARIAEVYNKGGYEEYPPDGVNAECYGTFTTYGSADTVNFYCARSNIYFKVSAYAHSLFLEQTERDIDLFPKIIADKI